MQTIELPEPTFSSQSESLLQKKVALPADVSSHFAVLLQATFAPAPTGPLQTEVALQARPAPAEALTLQVAALQAQFVAEQLQPVPAHSGPIVGGDPHPARQNKTAIRGKRIGRTLGRMPEELPTSVALAFTPLRLQ